MNIKNLTDLQKEKQKLRIQINHSQHEFSKSFNRTQTQSKVFLMKNIVTPFSLIGLTVLGIRQLKDNTSSNESSIKYNGNLLLKLLPVALPIMQSFLKNTDSNSNR